MRRPTKGATTHPTLVRPGMGYGRPLRPRPGPVARVELVGEIAAFLRGDVVEPVTVGDSDRSSVTSSDTLR